MRQLIGVIGTLLAPGFGQGLAGRRRRAAGWVAFAAASIAAVWWSAWATPLPLLARLAGIVDAYLVLRAARDRPRGDWMAAFAAAAACITLGVVAHLFVIEAFKIPASSMYPTLRIGDHLYTDKLSPRLRGVRRGEIIVFAQPCQPANQFIKRVIATAGETVELRCDVVYVNGKPLANQLVPGACHYDDFDESNDRWFPRDCSEYVETGGDHTYHVFHDLDRPERDRAGVNDPNRDFPRLDGSRTPPSCATSGMSAFEVQPTGTLTRQQPGTLVETRPGAGPCEPQLHYVVPEGHVFTLGDNRSNSNDSRYWGSIPLDHVIGRASSIWFPGQQAWSRLGRIE